MCVVFIGTGWYVVVLRHVNGVELYTTYMAISCLNMIMIIIIKTIPIILVIIMMNTNINDNSSNNNGKQLIVTRLNVIDNLGIIYIQLLSVVIT